MKFSSSIELLFTEYPFLERIKASKEHGFNGIEFWNWEEKNIEDIEEECSKNDLKVVTFVGNVKGQMVNPDDNEIFVLGVRKSIEVAQNLDCKSLILTTNTLAEDRSVTALPRKISDYEKKENTIRGPFGT